MGRIRGGMEFDMGRQVQLEAPPAKLASGLLRLTCGPRPLVAPGQKVQAGQRLADAADPAKSCVLCPVDGTVRSITPWYESQWDEGSGKPRQGSRGQRWFDVTLDPERESSSTSVYLRPPREDKIGEWFRLLRRIGPWPQPGIEVDLIAQLTMAMRRKPDMVMCVGLDAFPPYPTRSSLLSSFPDDAAYGLWTLANLVGARSRKLVVARQAEGGRAIRRACRRNRVRCVAVDNVYPAAEPTLMLYAHGPGGRQRRLLPHGHNPMERSVMLISPWTAIRIGRWLTRGKLDLVYPVMVGWSQADKPISANWVFAGQPLSTLAESLSGSAADLAGRAVLGHPMKGRRISAPVVDDEPMMPVVPEQEQLVALLTEAPAWPAEPCITCGWCVDVCPTQLQPVRLMELSESRTDDNYLADRLEWCVECGLCSHVCPSQLPLAQVLRTARRRLQGE